MPYINTIESKGFFQELLNSEYFVDKTELIPQALKSLNTVEKYLCITRPRRFGKSCNARMLACFLSRGLSAEDMFADLKVSHDEQAMKHLGAHDVIYIDFSRLPDICTCFNDYFQFFRNGIANDLRKSFPQAGIAPNAGPLEALQTVFDNVGTRFVFIMDEWDSMFFNNKFTKDDQKEFLMFLKQLLKGQLYVELAYMTGVLPIVKHSTGSELNMFTEFSAVKNPYYSEFFGFTQDEVKELCKIHEQRFSVQNKIPKVNFEGLKYWYDGYLTKEGQHMFNPRSAVLALTYDNLDSYWTESGPYDEVYYYIKNNIADVRDDLARMVAEEPVEAKMQNYAASAMSLTTKDEIFSAMVVYGFLTYYDGCVSIPNHELMLKFQDVMEIKDLGYIAKLAKRSKETLAATLRKDKNAIVKIIEAAHDEEIPLLRYAYEADLAALINLVYLAARDKYFIKREQPCGKGVADVAFIPMTRTDSQLAPFIVELKVAREGQSAQDALAEAMEQIKDCSYTSMFADALTGEEKFANAPLAVGISWDPNTKEHACSIEEY